MTNRSAQITIFDGGSVRARELDTGDIPALQQFFEANPGYFLMVTGQPPRHDEAHREFHDEVPADMPFNRKWLIGFIDEAGNLLGMASVVADFLAGNVWHIGLFVVSTSLHGGGSATAIHQQFESWMRAQGAQWIRLGVVEGNVRAERFWEKVGYRQVRKRGGVAMGNRVNTLCVMVKPLVGGTIADYLALVPRDRPE